MTQNNKDRPEDMEEAARTERINKRGANEINSVKDIFNKAD